MSIGDYLVGRLGMHPPGRLSNAREKSFERSKIIAGMVLWAVLRLIMIFISIVYTFLGYVLPMFALRPLKHKAPGIYFYIEGLLFSCLHLMTSWWVWSGGYKVEVCGDDISDLEDEEAILLFNHQSTADVPVLIYDICFYNRAVAKMLWILDILYRHTPFGIVSQNHGDFFIQTGKKTRHLQNQYLRKHLLNNYLPRKRKWIVLFPEGGFLYKQKKSCQEYAKKNGFPHLEYCTLPKVGAIQTILETLNVEDCSRPIRWIVDATIAYPPEKPLNLQTIFAGQRDPMDSTINYRKYSISEVPLEPEKLRDWVFDRYVEKDKMLETFYKTGKFPVPNKSDVLKNYIKDPIKRDYTHTQLLSINLILLTLTLTGIYVIYYVLHSCYSLISGMFSPGY